MLISIGALSAARPPCAPLPPSRNPGLCCCVLSEPALEVVGVSRTQLQPGIQHSHRDANSMASGILATPSPVLTETEAYVLTLYDQLQQLQLELALLRSQRGHPASSGQRFPDHIDLLLEHQISVLTGLQELVHRKLARMIWRMTKHGC